MKETIYILEDLRVVLFVLCFRAGMPLSIRCLQHGQDTQVSLVPERMQHDAKAVHHLPDGDTALSHKSLLDRWGNMLFVLLVMRWLSVGGEMMMSLRDYFTNNDEFKSLMQTAPAFWLTELVTSAQTILNFVRSCMLHWRCRHAEARVGAE